MRRSSPSGGGSMDGERGRRAACQAPATFLDRGSAGGRSPNGYGDDQPVNGAATVRDGSSASAGAASWRLSVAPMMDWACRANSLVRERGYWAFSGCGFYVGRCAHAGVVAFTRPEVPFLLGRYRRRGSSSPPKQPALPWLRPCDSACAAPLIESENNEHLKGPSKGGAQ